MRIIIGTPIEQRLRCFGIGFGLRFGRGLRPVLLSVLVSGSGHTGTSKMVFNQSFIEPLSSGDFIKVESNRKQRDETIAGAFSLKWN